MVHGNHFNHTKRLALSHDQWALNLLSDCCPKRYGNVVNYDKRHNPIDPLSGHEEVCISGFDLRHVTGHFGVRRESSL